MIIRACCTKFHICTVPLAEHGSARESSRFPVQRLSVESITSKSALTMLCPEVWSFEPPPSYTQFKFVANEKDAGSIVSKQYFNHFVSITIPDAIQIHPSLQNALTEDSDFYHVESLYAFELVQYEFVDLFVRKGQLTLLSVGTNLDKDDCVALTPTGKLIFSLRRKTFQELGLDGKPSSFSNELPEKYVVTIDLTEDCFKPGKSNYDRVLQRLKCKKGLCFNVVLAWEPHKTEICPSSIAAYIINEGYKVRTCAVKVKQRQDYNVDVPVFDDESDGEVLNEWLGAFNLQCNIPEKPNGYITTYGKPENHKKFGQVVYFEAVGLLTVTRIKKLLGEIRNYVSALSESAWLALAVSGFEDSVVNRGNQEHFFYSSGDYHYTLFFRAQGPLLLYNHTGSSRRPKTKTQPTNWKKKLATGEEK